MPEWPLYQPLATHLRQRGRHVATSVTDPQATRVEMDVVGFTPELTEVHVVEAKLQASGRLVTQGLDRLAYAARVHVAVPASQAPRLVDRAEATGGAGVLGILAVEPDGVRTVRAATPAPHRVATGKRNLLRRALRDALAEGRAEPPLGGSG